MFWPQKVKTAALNNPERGGKIIGEQLRDEDKLVKKQIKSP